MEYERPPLPVLGLGASAGGLQAVTSLLEALDPDLGIAYVLVQHLAPDHVSELHRLLQSHTEMTVRQVQKQVVLKPNTVYVIPPGRVLTLEDAPDGLSVTVSDRVSTRERRFPIDRFFRSIAHVQKEHAVCMILSGTGSDGTSGMKAIKEAGGLCLVQDPDEADYDGMPRSAIQTGLVDVVDTVGALAQRLRSIQHDRPPVEAVEDDSEEALQSIFVELRRQTGHVFGGYKRATILRRLARRMQLAEIDAIEDYAHHLVDHPEETRALFKDILISVTSFFRDPKAFAHLETEIIPELFRTRSTDDSVRVWVPGCATGEEAYSIAMLLLEQRERSATHPDIQVFATDVDADALQFARRGVYPASISSDVSKDRLSHFFSVRSNGYVIEPKVMDIVLFAEHNLVSDPPFSKLDLISCRNLLIYMSRELQEEVFGRLHYALNPEGTLFLGRSESVDSVADLFAPIHMPSRIFHRLDSPSSGNRFRSVLPDVVRIKEPDAPPPRRTLGALHRRLITEEHAPPSVLLDRKGQVLHVTGNTDAFMSLRAGHTTLDVLEMLAPPLRMVIRPTLYRAQQGQATSVLWEGDLTKPDPSTRSERRLKLSPPPSAAASAESSTEAPTQPGDAEPVAEPDDATLQSLTIVDADAVSAEGTSDASETPVSDADAPDKPLSRTENGGHAESKTMTRLRIVVSPADDTKTGDRYILIVFSPDADTRSDWQVRGRQSEEQQLFESMEEELQQTQHRMRTLMEEYETSTEELQTSNEELQSMNEELRSASEELQVRKQELQSTNEELLTVNEELKVKVNEVNQANADLENLLEATNIATVFLTRDLMLKRYTPQALDLFDIHVGDQHAPIHKIPHVFTDVNIHEIASHVYRTLQPVRREVQAGAQTMLMNVMPYRTTDDRIDGIVMTFVDISDRVELREERDEAYHASEMKSKMIANLSHEVRTPMTALLGFSEVLQEEAESPDAKRFGQLIYKSSLRLQNTLESVLHFSRLEAGKESTEMTRVNIVEELRETYDEQRARAEARGITLTLDVSEALPVGAGSRPARVNGERGEDPSAADTNAAWRQVWCKTDPGAVQRILRNLTGNAIKYTPSGGTVVLRCATGTKGILIEIEDDGMGMTPEFQQRMYEPFSQQSEGRAREFEGVGLGLAIVLKLTELIGASLEVESTPGLGTRFTLLLPRRTEP